MTQATKQNAPYGYYELGLRADMLEVELKAACAACTHLHEKLEAAEADWRASAERYDREVVQLRAGLLLAAADRDAFDEKLKEAEAEAAKWRDDAERLLQAKDALEAQRDRLESLLRKPGCWSEWARECLAVLSREGRVR